MRIFAVYLAMCNARSAHSMRVHLHNYRHTHTHYTTKRDCAHAVRGRLINRAPQHAKFFGRVQIECVRRASLRACPRRIQETNVLCGFAGDSPTVTACRYEHRITGHLHYTHTRARARAHVTIIILNTFYSGRRGAIGRVWSGSEPAWPRPVCPHGHSTAHERTACSACSAHSNIFDSMWRLLPAAQCLH